MFNRFTCDDASPTHLLMTGGKLKVRSTDIDVFRKEYMNTVRSNQCISVVEKVQKNRPFKMFFDFDFKEPLDNQKEFIVQFIHLCEEYLKKSIRAVVCLGVGTHGIHIILKDTIVTQDQGIQMCNALKTKKNNLDISVYKTGLRMIWSHKKNVKQFYKPSFIWYESQLSDLTEEESMDERFLDSCSIHTHLDANTQVEQNEEEITCYEIEPKDLNLINENLSLIHPAYTNAKITHVKRIKNDYYIQSYSRYCMNRRGNHRSNHVYFVMSKKKLYQKCYCTCDTTQNRTFGKCKNFSSKPVSIGWRFENYIKGLAQVECLFN